jgi:hypothetical protein
LDINRAEELELQLPVASRRGSNGRLPQSDASNPKMAPLQGIERLDRQERAH